MNGDLLWAIGLPKQHRFPLCYPCRNSSPVRASRISEGFKRPRFTVHNRERCAKLCANFVYCSTRWQSTQVGTGRNQRFTISPHKATTNGWSVTRTASESKRPVNQRGVVAGAGKTKVTGPASGKNGFTLHVSQHGVINIGFKLLVICCD